MKFNVKKIALVATTVLVAVGIAAAQGGNQPNPPAGGRGDRVGQGQFGQGQFGDRLRERFGNMGQGLPSELLLVVMDATGLEPQALLAEIRAGATLAEIITANGGDVTAVVNDAVAIITESVNEAVANGNLTQERADQMLADLTDNLTNLVNNGANRPVRDVMSVIAEAAGLTAEEMIQQVQDGAVIADLLTANGASVDAVVAEILAPMQERLAEQVAAGELTQALADARLNLMQVQLTEMLNGNISLDRMPFGQGGRGGQPRPRQ